jgi:hypothetical protein
MIGWNQEKNETRRQLKAKVETFITALLKITAAIEFDNLYRMGKPRDGVSRPIILELMRLNDRYELLKAKRNLKGSKIYLDVMLTERGARMEKQLRDKGKEIEDEWRHQILYQKQSTTKETKLHSNRMEWETLARCSRE